MKYQMVYLYILIRTDFKRQLFVLQRESVVTVLNIIYRTRVFQHVWLKGNTLSVRVCVYDQFDALDLAEFHAYSDTRYLARFN